MITVKFYKYSGLSNQINKPLSNEITLNGLFFQRFDILQPELTIRHTAQTPFNYNYCFIPELQKYYFITDCNILENGKANLKLKLDVLQTYKTDILTASGLIVSRENANKFISNRENIYNVVPQLRRYEFSVNKPFNENGNIIMITLKGK